MEQTFRLPLSVGSSPAAPLPLPPLTARSAPNSSRARDPTLEFTRNLMQCVRLCGGLGRAGEPTSNCARARQAQIEVKPTDRAFQG